MSSGPCAWAERGGLALRFPKFFIFLRSPAPEIKHLCDPDLGPWMLFFILSLPTTSQDSRNAEGHMDV